MRDVLPELLRWWRAGEVVAVATVVATFRSAPRPPGASMLVGPGGEAVGSVSGGCVEGAVHDVGTRVAATGIPVLERYGVSDDDALAVGLTCGGVLDVFVEAVSQETFPELGYGRRRRRRGPAGGRRHGDRPPGPRAGGPSPRRAARGCDGARGAGCRWPAPSGGDRSLGSARADAAVTDDARGLLALGRTETLTYGPDGERRGEGMRVFVASYGTRPRMLVFGAIDFAAAVAQVGRLPRLPGHRVRRPTAVRDAAPGSRPRTRSSSAGRTATWRRRPRPAGWTRARSCAC